MPFEYIAETIEDRLERFRSWQDCQPAYISRGEEYDVRNNVVAILHVPDFEAETITRYDIPGRNLIVDTGDTYYAQLGTGETVTNDFTATGGPPEGRMFLRTGSPTPAKSDTFAQVTTPITGANDSQNLNATYPRTNDPDGDNPAPGADVATWTYDWAAGEATSGTNIIGGAIVNATALPVPMGTDALLNHFDFSAPFTKPAGATLKVINNHTFNGT